MSCHRFRQPCADYLEQDVVATRDDELVVLHDIHLDTVTDVLIEDGKIAAHSIDRYLRRQDESADKADQATERHR